jgi:hypothetical protein
MQRRSRVFISLLLAALLLMGTVGCKELDVIGAYSVESFGTLLEAKANLIDTDETTGGWALDAPDGAARVVWNIDPVRDPSCDVLLSLDAKPLLDAGLDPSRLPLSYRVSGERIHVTGILEKSNSSAAPPTTALQAYERIVDGSRGAISYHGAMDHFGVSIGDGNVFEWAKDPAANDKDIVFALNPEPLIAAGLDPEAVEGWTYALVPVMIDGASTEVYKLLKPFDLL